MHAGADPVPAEDTGRRKLYARDVAARLAEVTGRDTFKTETVSQYLWLRNRRIRLEGQAQPSDIPEPDGYDYPPWRKSGMLHPYWYEPGPITAFIAERQPPGKPRSDGTPRTRRKATYQRPGPHPRRRT